MGCKNVLCFVCNVHFDWTMTVLPVRIFFHLTMLYTTSQIDCDFTIVNLFTGWTRLLAWIAFAVENFVIFLYRKPRHCKNWKQARRRLFTLFLQNMRTSYIEWTSMDCSLSKHRKSTKDVLYSTCCISFRFVFM